MPVPGSNGLATDAILVNSLIDEPIDQLNGHEIAEEPRAANIRECALMAMPVPSFAVQRPAADTINEVVDKLELILSESFIQLQTELEKHRTVDGSTVPLWKGRGHQVPQSTVLETPAELAVYTDGRKLVNFTPKPSPAETATLRASEHERLQHGKKLAQHTIQRSDNDIFLPMKPMGTNSTSTTNNSPVIGSYASSQRSPPSMPRTFNPDFFITKESSRDEWVANKKYAMSRLKKARLVPDSIMSTITDNQHFLFEPSKFVKLVKSEIFERIAAAFILANTIYLGVETSILANSTDDDVLECNLINAAFSVIFFVELLLRIAADGTDFCTKDASWNLFDVFIVLTTTVDSLSWAFSWTGLGGVGFLRFARVVRIFRILRTIQNIRLLSPLRLLISGIFGTFLSGLWSLILLIIIIYAFSVIYTQAATQHLRDCPYCDPKVLGKTFDLFGSMTNSMSTLFQSISGGINWGVALTHLNEMGSGHVGKIYAVSFLLYVAFTYFAVLNVVTALFCQRAVEYTLSDHELLIDRRLANLLQDEDKLEKLFEKIDEIDQSEQSPPGWFQYQDLLRLMEDPTMKAEFSLLGVEPEDPWTLFKLLDADDNGLIDRSTFVSGCMKFRGEARRVDLHVLLYEFRFFMNKTDRFMNQMFGMFRGIEKTLKNGSDFS